MTPYACFATIAPTMFLVYLAPSFHHSHLRTPGFRHCFFQMSIYRFIAVDGGLPHVGLDSWQAISEAARRLDAMNLKWAHAFDLIERTSYRFF